MSHLYIKALHVIFMVSWFAGAFFLGRLLIYFKEGTDKPSQDIVDLCTSGTRRVWFIIILPSMILTIIMGLWLAMKLGAFREGWLHIKLLMVIAYVYYTFYINRLRKKLINNEPTPSSWKLRLINEVPFFFLVGIVFTVYLKNLFSGLWALIVMGMLVVIVVLLMLMQGKKKMKMNREESENKE